MICRADVLVIGAGAAGCRAALEAHDRGAQVIVAAKGRFLYSGSTFYPGAMGLGYSSALPGAGKYTRFAESCNGAESPGGGPESHYREIMAAGLGMVSPALARILAEEAPRRLADLLDRYHTTFHQEGGQVLFRQPRFGSGLVWAGTATIEGLRQAFGREIRDRGIRVLERTVIARLLGDARGCVGAVGVTEGGDVSTISAKTTVLATGGGSTAFLRHMNTPDLTFDGHGLALALGAQLVNMEFYRMILGLTAPAPLPPPDWGAEGGLMIPESYLALLPRLTNGRGEEFLARYLPPGVTVAECLTTRATTGPFRFDAAARYFDVAVFDETRQGRGAPGGGVQADFTGCDPTQVQAGRWGWYEWARARGADLLARPVEVSPHVHAINGGVLINPQAETTVPNLFACGEAAGGPHGANRIGGNQFAGSQVFGARAGQFAAERAAELTAPRLSEEQVAEVQGQITRLQSRPSGRAPADVLRAIQSAMWNEMGVHKDAASLKRCRKKLAAIAGALPELHAPDSRQLFLALSLPNLLATSQVIVQAASLREESRGPHYRTDHPARNDARFGCPILVSRQDDKTSFRFGGLI